MTKTARTLAWLLPAILVFAAGFVLAAFVDLPLAHALYSPQNPLAILMEAAGWLPAFLPAMLLMPLVASAALRGPRRRWGILLAGLAMSLGVCMVVYWKSWDYFAGRGVAQTPAAPGFWVLVVLGLALYAGLLALAFRAGDALYQRLRFWALTGTIYLMGLTLLVNGIKLLWQRARFDTMLSGDTLELFTHWHQWGNGGSSFPSGHTANACGVFMVLVLCDLFPRLARHRKLLQAGCWLYVAGMALARMVIGRHFLSDTLAAAALCALLFWLLLASPIYRRALGETLATAPPLKRKRNKHAI